MYEGIAIRQPLEPFVIGKILVGESRCTNEGNATFRSRSMLVRECFLSPAVMVAYAWSLKLDAGGY